MFIDGPQRASTGRSRQFSPRQLNTADAIANIVFASVNGRLHGYRGDHRQLGLHDFQRSADRGSGITSTETTQDGSPEWRIAALRGTSFNDIDMPVQWRHRHTRHPRHRVRFHVSRLSSGRIVCPEIAAGRLDNSSSRSMTGTIERSAISHRVPAVPAPPLTARSGWRGGESSIPAFDSVYSIIDGTAADGQDRGLPGGESRVGCFTGDFQSGTSAATHRLSLRDLDATGVHPGRSAP